MSDETSYSEIEPLDDPIKYFLSETDFFNDIFQKARWFDFSGEFERLNDSERRAAVEQWVKSATQYYTLFDAVMWFDSSGELQALDPTLQPLDLRNYIFDLSHLPPRVVMQDTESLEYYDQAMRAYHFHLYELNTTMFILDKMAKFPIFTFVTADKTVLYRQTYRCYLHTAIVDLNMVLNSGSNIDILTFAGQVIKRVKPVFEVSMRKRITQAKLDVDYKHLKPTLVQRLIELRNKVIAHFEEGRFTDPNFGNKLMLDLNDLHTLHQVVNSFFKELTFGTDYQLWPPEYNPNITRFHPYEPDIDELLDAIARNSDRLNMPEKNPLQWEYLRAGLSPQKLAAINEYRKKFGMTEV
jgi:hypothetical protein